MIQRLLMSRRVMGPLPSLSILHERETETIIKRYPSPPWTAGHRQTGVIATSDSVLTYDEVIRCPSLWTPDHWMNAISPIPGISYDKAIRCPSLDTRCG